MEEVFLLLQTRLMVEFYTKAGDFKQGVDGKLITAGGEYVQGIGPVIQGDMIDNDMYSEFVASKKQLKVILLYKQSTPKQPIMHKVLKKMLIQLQEE